MYLGGWRAARVNRVDARPRALRVMRADARRFEGIEGAQLDNRAAMALTHTVPAVLFLNDHERPVERASVTGRQRCFSELERSEDRTQ